MESSSRLKHQSTKTTSKSNAKFENLHIDLLKWATTEMSYHTAVQNSTSQLQQKAPSVDDFKFLCSGQLVDVWKYVITHIKSVQVAKHIKGNVELRGRLNAHTTKRGSTGDPEEEKEKLLELSQQKVKLSQELQEIRADASQLERDMGHVTEELLNAETSYQSSRQRVRDLQRKENLLHVAHSCVAESTARYAEYTHRVDKCIADIVDKKEESKNNYLETKDEQLETESCHMVRQACDDINKFLYHSLDGSVDTSKLEKYKTDLLDKVDSAAAINSTHSLLSALAMNAESDAAELRQKTSSININKDAAEISFSYSAKKGLQDLSQAPSATETVKQLLHASSEQHVMRWFKTQEHLNEEWKLSSRQTETLGEINKLLHRLIGDHPAHLDAAKNYVTSRIRLAEERTIAPCLKKEFAYLTARIEAAKKERDELKLKYSEIQDFQKLVAKKQSVISKLAHLNANTPERLKSHRQQVESYLESRSVTSHLEEVRALPMSLKGSFIAELESFLQLLMPCLLTVSLDSHERKCILDLSIAMDVCPLASERNQTYTDVCKALEFPAFKSTDTLPLHVLDIHAETRQLNDAQRQRKAKVAAVLRETGTSDSIDAFIDLQRKAAESDESQCKKLMPLLEKTGRHLEMSPLLMEGLREAIHAWWNQPAQWTTPWVRARNLTFGHWMQHWRNAMVVASSKLVAGKR